MKTKLKHYALSFIYNTAPVGIFWMIYKVLGLVGRAFSSLYRRAEYGRNTHNIIEKHFSDLTVKHGMFKGMRYPSATSVGSTLLPKLLGSYEKELEGVFHTILQQSYDSVIDVGCAEGYYAIGLALRFPTTKIFAYDTDIQAQTLCADMARLNGVSERVTVGGLCDDVMLPTLPLGSRALIIADCEGYEKYLFTPKAVASLAHHDVLIEVHDVFDNQISTVLRERFKATHDLQVVESIDDLKKVRVYHFPELESYSTNVRLSIVSEGRGAIMEWFYFTPRTLHV